MHRLARMSLSATLVAGALLAVGCGRKPASLDIAPRKVIIYGVGRGKDLTVHVLDKKGTALAEAPPVAYSASPAGIVEVSSSGHVSGKKAGRATLSVSAAGLSASVPAEVRELAYIDIIPATLRLVGPRGTQSRLEIAGKTADGNPTAAGTVAWVSKNSAIASVSPDGVVTSVQAGKTTVTAKLADLFTESDVEVQIRNISRLEIRPETAIVKVGESEKFSVLAYDETGLLIADAAAQFSTPNAGLVKISGDGKATGQARGTSTIVATIGDKSARATLLVN
jgi:hypothetical protein